jgi:hypothetical protein
LAIGYSRSAARAAEVFRKISQSFSPAGVTSPFACVLPPAEARELPAKGPKSFGGCFINSPRLHTAVSYEKLESVLASILKGHVNCSGNKKPLSAEKTAHILTSAVRGFKLVAKSATELRKLIRDLVVIILAA